MAEGLERVRVTAELRLAYSVTGGNVDISLAQGRQAAQQAAHVGADASRHLAPQLLGDEQHPGRRAVSSAHVAASSRSCSLPGVRATRLRAGGVGVQRAPGPPRTPPT